jgi:hypothetical protein
MYTYPFEILKARAKAEIPELRDIDLYMDQDNPKDKNVLITASPGLYLRFIPSTTEDLGNRLQSTTAEFEAILLTECLLPEGSRRLKKEAASDHMVIYDKIFNAFSGFSARLSYLPEFSSLEGTKNDKRIMNSISRVHIEPPGGKLTSIMKSLQRFRVQLWDHAATKTYTPHQPGLAVHVHLEDRFTADGGWTVDTTEITADRI